VLKGRGMVMWKSEEMKVLNMFKADPPGHVSRFQWLFLARVMHAQTRRVELKGTRRENEKWIGTGHMARYYRLPEFLSS